MATTTLERRSDDDRLGSPRLSPFRAYSPSKRYEAAWAMALKREDELVALEALLEEETDPKRVRLLKQRILATRNNQESWLDYLADDMPREGRAVINPPKAERKQSRKAA